MPNWRTSDVSYERRAAVLDAVAARELKATRIRVEHRYRDRLCFEIVCACGHEYTVDVEMDGDIDFGVDVAWPRAHRGCAARIAAERERRSAVEAPNVPGDLHRATPEQIRELWRDPFIRAFLTEFAVPARPHGEPSMPNVIGATFPDGAVFRRGMALAPGEVLVGWPDTPYLPGEVVKPVKANWGKR
jgi:hypothetical protein